MYAFIGVETEELPDFDDQQFALDLLEQKHVLVAPGASFNVPYRNHFRVTNLPDAATLREVFGAHGRIAHRVCERAARARPGERRGGAHALQVTLAGMAGNQLVLISLPKDVRRGRRAGADGGRAVSPASRGRAPRLRRRRAHRSARCGRHPTCFRSMRGSRARSSVARLPANDCRAFFPPRKSGFSGARPRRNSRPTSS